MHIASDGNYYYTINGGNSGNGQISQFDLLGNHLQTYLIPIDGRGLSYNKGDGHLYASLYAGDIVRIDSLAAGTFTTILPAAMHDAQASFAMSPDGTRFYDFVNGTLYVRDFPAGSYIDTITGLGYGAGNYGGNAAVAVDSNFIYTWDATIRTVYVYDLTGTPVQTMQLDSGDNGHSISIANQLLFVSRDANYGTGTWFGYGNAPPLPPPVAALSSSDSGFCEKQCIDFYDLSMNSPTSWNWYFPNATPDTSTMQNPVSICYNSYGDYDVMLVACNASGCDTLLLTGYVHVFQSPAQPVISQGHDTLFTPGPGTFAWFEITNPAVVLSTDTFLVTTQNGNYYVTLTDSNGCQATSNIHLVNTGIPETGAPVFTFYPNPASQMIRLTTAAAHTACTVDITDATGRTVYSGNASAEQIDIHRFADGVYAVKVTTPVTSMVQRLVVAHR